MASLWKHPQSRYWVACFTDRQGRQRKRSTKETDRKKAQKIAEQYEAAARRLRTSRQVREVIASLHKEITGDELPQVSLREFVVSWIARKTPEASQATVAFYEKSTRKLLNFLGADADLEIERITSDHILRFRNAEAKRIAGRTVNNDLKCLRMVFKAAHRDGLITEDPTEFVDTVRAEDAGENEKRSFTVEELRRVYAVAGAEWKSMILFGLYTGQRLADIAMLTWQNIDLQRNEIRLVTRKTQRRLLIPIAPPLRSHIEKITCNREVHAALHPQAFASIERTGLTGTLSNRFGRLLADAGLRQRISHTSTGKGRDTRRERNALTFHSLRRTATTLLHEAGIPAAVAQELIGHDSEQVHQAYVRVGREALEKAAAVFPTL